MCVAIAGQELLCPQGNGPIGRSLQQPRPDAVDPRPPRAEEAAHRGRRARPGPIAAPPARSGIAGRLARDAEHRAGAPQQILVVLVVVRGSPAASAATGAVGPHGEASERGGGGASGGEGYRTPADCQLHLQGMRFHRGSMTPPGNDCPATSRKCFCET